MYARSSVLPEKNALADGVAAWPTLKFLDVHYDETIETLWMRIKESSTRYFAQELLTEIVLVQNLAKNSQEARARGLQLGPVKHLVFGSRQPGTFSLGGDLALFRRLIVQRDKANLTRYANLALNAVINHVHASGPTSTTSLVQGAALGGGFEAALAGHTLVAEKRCRFGFPEILFGLFPGMGAYTLLRRRISAREAKDVITGGGTWLAEDLHRLGVVDHLCEQGEGEVFVTKMLYRHSRKPGLTRFLRAASRLSGSELDEMRRITNEWVSAALDLSEECLVRMDKIVAYQHRVNLEAARGPIVTIKRIGEPAGMP